MTTQKALTEHQKLKLTGDLLDFLKKKMTVFDYDEYVLEVLLLAYHASSNTSRFKELFS